MELNPPRYVYASTLAEAKEKLILKRWARGGRAPKAGRWRKLLHLRSILKHRSRRKARATYRFLHPQKIVWRRYSNILIKNKCKYCDKSTDNSVYSVRSKGYCSYPCHVDKLQELLDESNAKLEKVRSALRRLEGI